MTLIDQALAAHQKGDTGLAKKLYEEVLKQNPNQSAALNNYGLILSKEEPFDGPRVLAMMEKAVSLSPQIGIFHSNIGEIYSRMGQIDKSRFHYEEAIRLKPDCADAYQGLTGVTSCKGRTDLLEQIKDQLQRNSDRFDPEQKSYLYFAAAKICEDSGMYDEAFDNFAKGNAVKNVQYNLSDYLILVEQGIHVFSREFVEKRKEWGLYDHTPIFILGMPRSGSTLTEQALCCHSQVYGAGELPDIIQILRGIEGKTQKPYPFCLQDVPQITLLNFALGYINRLKQLSGNMPRVINKSPINFRHIGFLLLLFPNAKIIHTVRDPIDTCLSCFFQNFNGQQSYSFDLENLAGFYNSYRRLMAHWESLYPGKIFHSAYEDMVQHQEETTRALVDFCELPWEDACLRFNENKRDVNTASQFQVRQPLYKKSIKRWKRYEKQLQPLISRLEYTE